MVKKRVFVILLVAFVFLLIFINFLGVYYFGISLSPISITGKVVETGYVRLYVEGAPKVITIHFPENSTYSFDSYTCARGFLPKCDNYRYILPLNVSANFYLEDVNPWKYSLYDSKHGEWVYEDIPFTPNTTVPFVRWGNVLTVFANEEDSDWVDNTVVFNIEVPDSAPIISGLPDELFVCEGQRTNDLSDAYFNVTDVDEESFSGREATDISPKDTLFDVIYLKNYGYNTSLFRIVSVTFNKLRINNYEKEISVIDPTGYVDTANVDINVIEVNNAPTIQNDLGAQTVWTSGADSVFSHNLSVYDVEDGYVKDGKFTFDLTWDVGNLGFDIDSTTGEILYIPRDGDQGSGSRTYALTVCVNDTPLETVHQNFSICEERGYSSDSLRTCDSFTLTVTDSNRAPRIVSYSPSVSAFNVTGTTSNSFSATVLDDDMVGSYPDLDWYVDGVLVESNENISSDSFSYTFPCGISGAHNVTVNTSDGLLSDSHTWDIDVIYVDCPISSTTSSGGGGGGGGAALGGVCYEQWVCNGWGLCQNAQRSFKSGSLSPEDYASVKDLCAQNQFDDRFCGFQITRCFDLNRCNNSEILRPKPVESRVCYFTEDPNCFDGITNCHDGDCELLVDCGGPCEPCPTCSDGKKNQGEQGVDCGGPCPYSCPSESPFGTISVVLISLLILLVIVVLFILFKLVNIIRYRYFFVAKKKKRKH
jgi:hypothetical protein